MITGSTWSPALREEHGSCVTIWWVECSRNETHVYKTITYDKLTSASGSNFWERQ
jgi:hypothetical protein